MVVLIQKRKKREQIALLLEELLAKHPDTRVYVAWDNADTHSGGKVEEGVRAAAGRLVLLYLLTYSSWLNPIEMRWRHFRSEVTHGQLFASVQELLAATTNFFDRYYNKKENILALSGAIPT
jgi:putative transposase